MTSRRGVRTSFGACSPSGCQSAILSHHAPPTLRDPRSLIARSGSRWTCASACAANDHAEAPNTEPQGNDPLSRTRREAAGYRTKLRDTEAERDRLRDRLAGYQRAEVEQVVADRLTSVEDFWLTAQLDHLLDPDAGTVDEARVREALVGVAEQLDVEAGGLEPGRQVLLGGSLPGGLTVSKRMSSCSGSVAGA